ncbi:hypothetical protein DICVIV_04474 [Dictyocaulus viviparus]|uniref:Uncharacterized protein n=1 Tax=Dictyocaulus viviparus TaxID=29172 RepID=A0A0D8Y496_DICVI|nr:hypothetical protein DICVIV_04474 [Dictyocaulus viviparus]
MDDSATYVSKRADELSRIFAEIHSLKRVSIAMDAANDTNFQLRMCQRSGFSNCSVSLSRSMSEVKSE